MFQTKDINIFSYFFMLYKISKVIFLCRNPFKQTQSYDARLCTSNQEKHYQTKNKLPKQLVRSVGCRYGVQMVLLITSLLISTSTNPLCT